MDKFTLTIKGLLFVNNNTHISLIHFLYLLYIFEVKKCYFFFLKTSNLQSWFNGIFLSTAPLTLNLEINVDGGDRPTNVGMPVNRFSEEEVSEILQDLLH